VSLAPGQRLGPYEIVAKLGEGGMGEVWRARDPNLGREVALKVLPEGFAADPERLQRFEREAKLLAQLNHPNIAQIYGLEVGGETRALVMELVEGPTLAERLEREPSPVSDSLSLALQIAQALEEAHEKGIVHRDLKPQNIKVSRDGRVKVLDFGLAKAMDPLAPASGAGSASQLAHSPTLTIGATVQGVILGTAAYMAPEQAKGMPVDKRADIWAFGVVLYEMLAGGRLFAGDSVTDTLADVLRREIDFAALPAETPPAIRDLVRRCLQRSPRNRLHDIADARLVIEEALAGGGGGAPASGVATPPSAPRGVRMREIAGWTLAAASLALAATLALRSGGPAPTSSAAAARPIRFWVPFEPGATPQGLPAVAPDGRTVVYVAQDPAGVVRLAVHSLEAGTTRWLAGTEGAEQPFFGSDPQRLGFFAASRLKQVDLASALVRDLHPVPDPRGGAWTAEGDVLVSMSSSSPIVRVSLRAGETRPVTELSSERGDQSHRYPWLLPDGGLLYTSMGSRATEGIYWRGREGAPRRILADLSRAAFDAGRLFWTRQGVLLAQSFDPATGELTGEPIPVAERVGKDAQKGGEDWYGAGGGTVAYLRGGGTRARLVWQDRTGKELSTLATGEHFFEPALSPDGTRIVLAIEAGERQGIWVYDASERERGRRLTFADDGSETATWSPDGRWIAYTEPREQGGWTLVRRAADGSGEEEVLLVAGAGSWIDSWSADGSAVIFERHVAERGAGIWQLRIGEREPTPLVDGPANETHAAASPDGHSLAYVSDETGTPQLFVRALDGSGSRWQVSQSGGDWPVWRADGRELYFVDAERVLHAVAVLRAAPFEFEPPEALFRLRTNRPGISSARTAYAPSLDGRRFLVNQILEDATDSRLELVLAGGR
jgi:Tol biopolymer transport system component